MSFPSSVTVRPSLSADVASPPAAPQDPPPQAMRLLQVVLEAMAGRRPLHQLRPHLEHAAFLRLSGYVDAGIIKRMVIGKVRTQMPSTRAVEASVSLALGGRWISCVARLDVRERAWVCSDLTILEPVALARVSSAAA